MAADRLTPTAGVHVFDSDALEIIARAPFPNAMLIGPLDVAGALIGMLLPRLRRPVAHCDQLPFGPIGPAERGTLVLWSVDRLDALGQRSLLRLLDDRKDRQIISVATANLFDQVHRGEFPSQLYYRLNTVLLKLDAGFAELPW